MPEPSAADSLWTAAIGATSFWVPRYTELSAWQSHAPFAFWLTGALRPRTYVELGTHWGFSYFAFCQAVASLELETRCFAVDTWLGDVHAGFYGEDIHALVAGYNQANYSGFSTLLREAFDAAHERFAPGSIDLLHIDGCHLYEDVRHDFEHWSDRLSERAVVLFHDTEVRDRDFGVHRFWDELSGRYPHFRFTHGHGLGVLGFGAEQPPGMRALFDMSNSDPDGARIREVYSRLGAAIETQSALERKLSGLQGIVDGQRIELDRANRQLSEAVRREAGLSASLGDAITRLGECAGREAGLSASLQAETARLKASNDRARRLDRRLRRLGRKLAETESRVGLLPWLARAGLWASWPGPGRRSAGSRRSRRPRR